MSAAALERLLEREGARLPGPAARRREALDSFLANGFPTRRDEAWRYTDLKPIATAGFDAPPPAPSAALRARVAALVAGAADGAAGRIVLLDGRLDEGSSRLGALPPGVEIARLGADWERFDRAARGARLDAHPLAQLNRAFASDGVAVRVAEGAAADTPLELFVIAGGEAEAAQHPRISIELEPRAHLALIVHGLDAGPAPSWVNLALDARLAEGSRLTLHRLQAHGPSTFQTSVLAARLGKDATLEAGYVDVGARLARNDIDVTLEGAGAGADLFGVFLASPGRHVDDHVQVDHAAPHTASRSAFRGIADRHGRGVFRGKVVVRPEAQQIDARQSSDNLLLAEQAEIDTRPELEIHADDVKCSHGATVGELDLEQLFYLRSRGLDEDAARALLTFAFASSLLGRLGPERLRERAEALLAEGLPGRDRREDLA